MNELGGTRDLVLRDELGVTGDSVLRDGLTLKEDSVLEDGVELIVVWVVEDDGVASMSEEPKVAPTSGMTSRVGLTLCRCRKMRFENSKKRVRLLEFFSSTFVAAERLFKLIRFSFITQETDDIRGWKRG